jgi:hypothetical protein
MTDNNFAADTYRVRIERLHLIQLFYPKYAVELANIPPEVGTWAETCYTVFTRKQAVGDNRTKAATTGAIAELDIVRKEYMLVKNFAGSLFDDYPHLFESYFFHLPYPTSQKEQLERVEDVLKQNQRMINKGILPVLPEILITRLSSALDSATAAQTAKANARVEQNYLQRLLDKQWDIDTKNLQLLYSWCIVLWNDNHINLNDFGFARTDQYGRVGRPRKRNRHAPPPDDSPAEAPAEDGN